MGNIPDHYKQTAQANDHGLTVVEGQIHDLVWKCRFCGETAREKRAIVSMECTS